ncbi:MAG: hypothetical protein IT385_26910 [Deltaproteobacteria bacterium]|nr:hypothetical protein [Deltaproteobacteria bacterium]
MSRFFARALGPLALLMAPTAFAKPVMVEVCHVPPDAPWDFHTIQVPLVAAKNHLAHGDFLGPCDDYCRVLCDDGDACTVDDDALCELAGCPTDPTPIDCDDSEVCTDDYCDPASGCVYVNNPDNACADPNASCGATTSGFTCRCDEGYEDDGGGVCVRIPTGAGVDFTAMPLGPGVPDPFELVWNDKGQTVAAGIDEFAGAKGLYVQVQSSPYYRLFARHKTVVPEDVQVLFEFARYSYGSFILRGQGDGHDGANGYQLEFWTHYSESSPGYVMLHAITNQNAEYAGRTRIAMTSCTECIDGSRLMVRYEVRGSNVRARWWPSGQAEPTTWAIDVTDTRVTGAGHFGFSTYTNWRPRFGRIAWALEGDASF